MAHRLVVLAFVVVMVASTSGCGRGADETVGVTASCAAVVEYEGHWYVGSHVDVPALEGRSLGDGTTPPCEDTGPSTHGAQPRSVGLVELSGVSPTVAVLSTGHDDLVYIRDDVDRSAIPAALAKLIRPLVCRRRDEPIRFEARLEGVASTDPRHSSDLRPPLDLWIRVLASSPRRYERGSVRVRVPADARVTLTRADVRALWASARLELSIHCLDSAYIADRLVVRPHS
jgi:uncharacterized protein DUF6281